MIDSIGEILALYPRQGQNAAKSGKIPMEFFEQHEVEIRRAMRAAGMMLFYRGPRRSNQGRSRSMTRRCDATHVVLYHGRR